MSKKPVFSCLVLAATAASLLFFGALPAAAQGGCVPFNGIQHCPVGAAQLSLSSDGSALIASGLGPGGGDGVTSAFSQARFWQANTSLESAASEDTTVLSSISNSVTTSTATLQHSGDLLELSATFTGDASDSSYSVIALNGGAFAGGIGGISSGGIGATVQGDGRRTRRLADGFEVIIPSGACRWDFILVNPMPVTFPDGSTVLADQIQLLEEVDGPGHYPYTGFDAIVTQSTANAIMISDETVVGAI